MTRRISSLSSMAATLLIPALSGCVYLHKDPPPVPLLAQAPSPEAPPIAPLYTAMSQTDPALPELPSPGMPGAQPAPPPESIIAETKKSVRVSTSHRRGHKLEGEVAERETREREARDKDAATSATIPDTSAPPAEGQTAKVTAPTPKGDTAQPTSIGPLLSAPSADSSGSHQEAAELIVSTQRGVNGLHNLKGDQTKTVAQIRSFLDQAERALHNGDLDGAHTLATKAKTLLVELTGSS